MLLCFYILISLPNHKMKTKFFFILLLKFNRFNSFLIDMNYHFSLWNRHRWFELQLEFSISIKRKHMLSSFTASMWLKSEKYRNSSFFFFFSYLLEVSIDRFVHNCVVSSKVSHKYLMHVRNRTECDLHIDHWSLIAVRFNKYFSTEKKTTPHIKHLFEMSNVTFFNKWCSRDLRKKV